LNSRHTSKYPVWGPAHTSHHSVRRIQFHQYLWMLLPAVMPVDKVNDDGEQYENAETEADGQQRLQTNVDAFTCIHAYTNIQGVSKNNSNGQSISKT